MKIFKHIAFAALAVLATGCDFLDQNPDERVDADNLNESQLVTLIAGSYPVYNPAWICELSSDNYVDNNAPNLPASEREEQKLIHFKLTPYDVMDSEIFAFKPVTASTGTDSPTGIWEGYYNSIAGCNQILASMTANVGFDVNRTEADFANEGEYKAFRSRIEGMSEKMRAVRAESLILRAFNHFVLVNVFSPAFRDWDLSKADVGVPYVTVPEDKVMVMYDRGNVAGTYAKIKADLMEGLKDVSDVHIEKPAWRFTIKAANAFAARFSLYTRDYANVIKYANLVLGEDYSTLPLNLMDNTVFKGASMGDDYIKRWQSPTSQNNLMLLATYSLFARHCCGQRYGLSSIPLREIYYRTGVNWHWTAHPHAIISGALYYRGKSDYGFFSMKVGEEFQYSDKIAGIGYPHIIRREFTGNHLLLERAEAYIMTGQKDNAYKDLLAYDDTRRNMDEENKKTYVDGGGMDVLTQSMIEKWFVKTTNPNCKPLESWNTWFSNMSPTYPQLTAEYLPLINCLNEMKRYETVQEGFRFFDLKRWGVEYSHEISDGEGDKYAVTLTSLDPRRAIELPQEVLAAGMQSSRTKPTSVSPASSLHSAADRQERIPQE